MLNKDNVRELAYLVKITDVKAHPNADRLDIAVINGWECIVGKGEFTKGQLGVYFEIDSLLPDVEPFNQMEFLKSKHYKIKGQKIRGSYSMGLLMSLDNFSNTDWGKGLQKKAIEWNLANFDEKAEVRFLTQMLKVTYAVAADNKRKGGDDVSKKYQSMAARHKNLFKKKHIRWLMRREWGRRLLYLFFGSAKKDVKSFPTHFPFVHKSDEERVENMPWILENKTRWIKTTKIDGTSSLFVLERKRKKKKFEYYVCSRNVRQLDRTQDCFHADNVYWEANDKYHIEDFLRKMLDQHPEWTYVALQGETAGCSSSGTPIQGDPHKFGELRFFGYNFITSDIGRWNSVKAAELCEQYGIEWVPIVDDNYILPDDFEDFKKSADGLCEARGASGRREGYVYRNYDNNTLSFKNVSREYLLKVSQ